MKLTRNGITTNASACPEDEGRRALPVLVKRAEYSGDAKRLPQQNQEWGGNRSKSWRF